MRFLAPCIVLAVVTLGCSSKPQHSAQPRISARIAEGVKFDPIRDKEGRLEGISIEREKGGGGLSCQCPRAGCAQRGGAPCQMITEDHTGWTEAWCVGGCFNSEGNDCGGCVLGVSDGGSGGGSGGAGPGHDAVVTIVATGAFEPSTSPGNSNPSRGSESDKGTR